MKKAADIAKVSVKGSFHFMWGLVISTVISAVGVIFVANLLSSEEYGLYALAVAAPGLIAVFRDWGVSAALIRYTAQYNSEKQVNKTRQILVAGIVFEVAAGAVLTAISFLLSSLFAELYHIAAITPLIQVISFTILINAFITIAQSAFTGFERMELNSLTLIILSLFKTLFTPLLVVMGLGVLGAVLGLTFAFLIAGIAGTVILWMMYKKLRPSSDQPATQLDLTQKKVYGIKENTKQLLKYGLPLQVAGVIGTSQTQFYTVLMGIFVTTEAVGNYSIATTFVVLLTFFATPITTMLFPAFSKLDPQRDKASLQSVYQFSVKYASLLVVPLAMVVMALSGPGIFCLFGTKYSFAPLFLTLLALSYVFTAFGSLTVSNLINGQGKTRFTLKLGILNAAIGFPLSIVLVWQMGVVGIIVTTLVSGLPSLFIALRWIKKHYSIDIDWVFSAKILFSSSLAAVVTFMIQAQSWFSSWINLLFGAVVFSIIFFPSMVLTRTISKGDIENLREMTTTLEPINRLINPALNLIEKILVFVNRLDRESCALF